jgi:hypothetical protein
MLVSLLTLLVALFSLSLSTRSQPEPSCQPGERPAFRSGFAALKAQLGPAMGEPVECEHINPRDGDVLQRTTTGLAYHRKGTSIPIFTNGHDHWALTPSGLAHWTGWHASMAPPGGMVASSDDLELQLPVLPVPYASLEAVSVVQAPDHASGTMIVSRAREGGLFLIETSPECLGTALTSGQVVFVRSPGDFAAAGSHLILAVGGRVCPISDSRPL